MKLKRILSLLTAMTLFIVGGCTPATNGSTSSETVSEKQYTYYSTGDGNVYRLEEGTEMYFNGRWFDKELNGQTVKATTNNGAELYFAVEGTDTVTIHCPDNGNVENTTPIFAYCIDGGSQNLTRVTVKDDKLTITLPDTNFHLVRVITESLNAGVKKWDLANGYAVAGIDAGVGKVTGIKPMNKSIAIYGDSITEGDFVFGLNWNNDSSGTYTYAWQAARELSAVPYICGYGSSGITGDGFFKKAIIAVDNMSNGIPDPGAEDPAVIVINHAANDRNASNEVFSQGYRELINRLHEKHPNAVIFALAGFRQDHAQQIEEVANEYNFVHFVPSKDWKLSYTDGLHPNVEGAKKAGKNLADAIKAVVGEDYFKYQA